MGRSLEWNWLALAACLFLFPFVFGLYFIPESPPWLIYNDEEDLGKMSLNLISWSWVSIDSVLFFPQLTNQCSWYEVKNTTPV